MRLALLTALVLASTTGCAAFSDDSAGSDGGQVQVAAAFYPLAFVAERVGGDHVDVTNLTQPGAEPHDLELTVKETAEIEDADLVLVEHGFQPAVDDAVEQVSSGHVLDAADVVSLLPAEEHEGEEHADEGHADEGHADEGHADEEHEADEHEADEHEAEEHEAEEHEGEGAEHDHGELDPHFWQDPDRMATLTDAVADKLADIDPDHADDYRSNAEALDGELRNLTSDYEQGLAGCQRNTIVVSHDAFSYLSRFGLQVEGIAGLSPDAEPTPADLARLQQLITSDGITTVFSERLASKQLAQTLADDMGITTAVLDPIEGLSDETTDEDYVSLMRENLSALELANGCP